MPSPPKLARVGPLADAVSMFSRIPRNTRTVIAVEPMWSIPFAMYNVYATIYMRALGLTPAQVGIVLALGHLSNTLMAIVSGGITDRLGRKRTALVFDLLGWTAPILLWATARSFPSFVAAALMNGFASVVGSAWTCLLVEDTPPEDRTAVFTAVQLSWVAGGFFCPLSGMLVGWIGIVTGCRLLYWFAFLVMTIMFVVRNALIKETSVGRERMAATRQVPLFEVLGEFGSAVRLMRVNHLALVMLGLSTMLTLRDALIASMGQIYLVEAIRMKASTIALFPLIGSAVQLVALLVLVPAMRPWGERVSIAAGLWMVAAGAVLYVLAVPGRLAVAAVGLSTFASAGGLALASPAVNATWNNAVEDRERASLMAVLAVVGNLARAAGAFSAGLLYSVRPVLPFLVILGLAVTMLLVNVAARRFVDRVAGGVPAS